MTMIARLYLTYLGARHALGRALRVVGLFYAVMLISLMVGACFEIVVGQVTTVNGTAMRTVWFLSEIAILLYWFGYRTAR